jgi:predicted HTH transcriptional regulator
VPTIDEGKAKAMKTVCAFANGQGGSILYGIDDDDGVVGVPPKAIDLDHVKVGRRTYISRASLTKFVEQNTCSGYQAQYGR